MAGILSIQFEPLLNEIDKNLEKVKTIIENFVKENGDIFGRKQNHAKKPCQTDCT